MDNVIRGLKIALLVILAIVAFGFVTMHLWNWLMPEIFGLPIIDWYQAIGLIILSKILFGGFRGKHKCGGENSIKGKIRSKFRDKYESMSEEEKEKFKKKCGSWLTKDDDC